MLGGAVVSMAVLKRGKMSGTAFGAGVGLGVGINECDHLLKLTKQKLQEEVTVVKQQLGD